MKIKLKRSLRYHAPKYTAKNYNATFSVDNMTHREESVTNHKHWSLDSSTIGGEGSSLVAYAL
jgi:hypothetical protein